MSTRTKHVFAVIAFVYVAAVLVIDCLATRGVQVPFDWSVFYRIDVHVVGWSGNALQVYGADYFKLFAWFVVPVALAVWTFPVRWITTGNWKPVDKWLLGTLFVLGAGAVVSVKFIPALQGMYPSQSHLPQAIRWSYLGWYLVWILTWLPGWEFMHRYVLVRAASAFPRHRTVLALTLIPLFEALYHVGQGKALIECAAMAVFSLICTVWVLRRENMLLPFIAHAFIEVGLILFLLFV